MNITPGTALWAIQQLLEGKKIRCKSWGPEEYIYIKDDVIFAEDGDVQSLTHSMFNYTGWLLWSPPNPYPKGTFAWAWEELQRGNKVVIQHGDFSIYYWKKDTDYYAQIANSEPGVAVSVMLSDINSTNWELADP